MKEIITRQVFLKRLEKKLRFKYNKDDVASIIGDYNEFFDIEMTQGKSEKQVCLGLGNPQVIVENLILEVTPENSFSRKLFSKKSISKNIFIAIICLTIASIIYKLAYDHSASMLINLLVAFPIIALLLWIVLKDESYTSRKILVGKNNLRKMVGAHLICFFVMVVLFVFLKNGLALNLKPQQIGGFVTGILYLFISLLCGIILFSTYQVKKNSIAYYSVTCHALGVLTVTLYYINVLGSLANPDVYSLNIMKSGFIYLESIGVVTVFLTLLYKRSYANESTT